MPVYRATLSDSPPDQFAYVLNEITVKGTLYEQDVVILDGDVKTTMKPPAAEWLREAIDYRIRDGWPRRESGPTGKASKRSILSSNNSSPSK